MGQALDRSLSITELTTLLNTTLEEQVGVVSFQGEISQITRAASGHIYFTLKDPNSDRGNQLPCVLWRNAAQSLSFRLEEGMAVVCRGKPNVYLVSGRLQMLAYDISPAGEGVLRARFEALRKALEAEGLFAPERKRRLPFLPRVVGVVTSASGAALQDVLAKLQERMPGVVVYLAAARVQGDGAAEEVAASLQVLSAITKVEVIIVARGGGSLQDLWAFNEEVVVRAVFACTKPVVSGVGHEVDVTLTDLVADVRAPTPTAAAELVVPDVRELAVKLQSLSQRLLSVERGMRAHEQSVDEISLRLEAALKGRFELAKVRLANSVGRLGGLKPQALLSHLAVRVDGLQGRLLQSVMSGATTRGMMLRQLSARLELAPLKGRLGLAAERLRFSESRLHAGVMRQIEACQQRLNVFNRNLDAVSPKAVFDRGYAMVVKDGRVVRDAAAIAPGDIISTVLARGSIVAEVRESTGVGGDMAEGLLQVTTRGG